MNYYIAIDNETHDISEINDNQFKSNTNIKKLVITDISTIGRYAFKGCTNLTSITFNGDKLTKILNSAFCGCTSLTSITLPSSVSVINESAFKECSSLVSIDFGEGSQLDKFSAQLFYKCSKLSTISNIPPNLIEIEHSCFADSNITEIDLTHTLVQRIAYSPATLGGTLTISVPSTIKEIGYNGPIVGGEIILSPGTTYSDLEYVHTEQKISSPGYDDYDFGINRSSEIVYKNPENMEELLFIKKVTIANTISRISDDTFKGCKNLEEVIFEEGSRCEYIGNGAFTDTKTVSDMDSPIIDFYFDIPDSVSRIHSSAFGRGMCVKLSNSAITISPENTDKKWDIITTAAADTALTCVSMFGIPINCSLSEAQKKLSDDSMSIQSIQLLGQPIKIHLNEAFISQETATNDIPKNGGPEPGPGSEPPTLSVGWNLVTYPPGELNGEYTYFLYDNALKTFKKIENNALKPYSGFPVFVHIPK